MGHDHGCCDALDISAVPVSKLYLVQKVRCAGTAQISEDVNEVQVDIGDDQEVTLILPKRRTTTGPILFTVCSGSVTITDPVAESCGCEDSESEDDGQEDLVLTGRGLALATFGICCEWIKGKLASS